MSERARQVLYLALLAAMLLVLGIGIADSR